MGEDIVFSCFLSPETNAEAMEVWFFKDHFSDIVHSISMVKIRNICRYQPIKGEQSW
jgi:hypothetical protein